MHIFCQVRTPQGFHNNTYRSKSLSTKVDGLEYRATGRNWIYTGTSAGFSRKISSSYSKRVFLKFTLTLRKLEAPVKMILSLNYLTDELFVLVRGKFRWRGELRMEGHDISAVIFNRTSFWRSVSTSNTAFSLEKQLENSLLHFAETNFENKIEIQISKRNNPKCIWWFAKVEAVERKNSITASTIQKCILHAHVQ